MEQSKQVMVAVGILVNQQHILISKRPLTSHQGGKWEFPGGKVNHNESITDALVREFDEELGICVIHADCIGDFEHTYEDLVVKLHVFVIGEYHGIAYGKEGQEIKWSTIEQLQCYNFPAANQQIIELLKQQPSLTQDITYK